MQEKLRFTIFDFLQSMRSASFRINIESEKHKNYCLVKIRICKKSKNHSFWKSVFKVATDKDFQLFNNFLTFIETEWFTTTNFPSEDSDSD